VGRPGDDGRDAEREARLEANKLRAEAAKTLVLISSGFIVAMAAVASVLPTSRHLEYLFAAFVVVSASVVLGLVQMFMVAEATAARRHGSAEWTVIPALFLGVGLLTFAPYVLFNIPQEGAEDSTLLDRAAFGAALGIPGGFLLLVVALVAARLWDRRKQRRRSGGADKDS
jgi:heme/copper-type cytochrome/quinol oxidase subunit 3